MNLKSLASEISKVYMQNPKVEAVLLGGSVARNWNDDYSDIELFVFWRESPTEQDRKLSIHTVNGKIIDFHPYEEEEWSETYITQEVKLEISNFLTQTIYKIINDVIVKYETDLDKQCLVASVNDGISLGGEEMISQLKEKVKVYPKELSKAMIRNNIYLGNRWSNREALLAREDWLMLYMVIVSAHSNIMGILFGLNRLYVHHPAYKWQNHSLEKMTIVPKNISSRLNSILLEHPKKAVIELENIIQEIYQLIQSEYPTMDLYKVMDQTLFLRPKQN
ncbi:DUF4037 domain-containing protein [Virgibacillus sp. C22-A2]|uniref:DUF4037 domain-containing protein n=1 Tax=Virgibacillus tibetensis TaxID=3042313 RepID=A0ABU6KKW0_9BACI|nr:DUF4037 domain-containing protein [Virgibacillus sp. C22-A2]